MAYYLLTYFNDVIVGRNILIDSHEQRQVNLNQKQTSGILIAVAVMMRKKC